MTLMPLGRALLLSGLDIDLGIDLRKIEGEKGATSLTSKLEMVGRKAQLGPVDFEYGGVTSTSAPQWTLTKTPTGSSFLAPPADGILAGSCKRSISEARQWYIERQL